MTKYTDKEIMQAFKENITPLLEKYQFQHITLTMLDKKNMMSGVSFNVNEDLMKIELMEIDKHLLEQHIKLLEDAIRVGFLG